jgi:competence protein ComEC
MNITIIAAVLMSSFRRILGTRKGLFAAGIGIVIYTVLVGGDAAVVRSAIMGTLTLLATRLGRQTHGFASLGTAAIVMTAIDPDVLRDVGFQLSFAATLGLMVFTPPLERGFTRIASSFLSKERATSLTKPVSEFVLYTFAAQLMTMPLSATYFQQLSLTSFIANPLILPAQPLLMITAGIATIAGMIWIPLGRLLASIAWPFPAFTIWVVSQFASFSLGNLNLGHSGPLFAIIWYLILTLIIIILYLPADKRPSLQLPTIQTSTAIIGLLITSTLLSRSILDKPDGKLHVSILDVGDGDAVLIQSPSGRYILVDGGPSPIKLSDSLGRRLPFFARNLDWLILTGTKEGQLGGLAEAVPRFPPNAVLLAGPPRTGAYRYFMDQIAETGVSISPVIRGQRSHIAEEGYLEVILCNEQSAALLLSYGNFRLLIAPSADPALIEDLNELDSSKNLTAVLLPDSGSELANPPEWLGNLDPELILISVGAGNSRGLPSEAVLRALEGRTILRTDLNGTIDIRTDGEQMWVEVERELTNVETGQPPTP